METPKYHRHSRWEVAETHAIKIMPRDLEYLYRLFIHGPLSSAMLHNLVSPAVRRKETTERLKMESYYATTFHELGHWSGAEKRLDRNLTTRFGTEAYAAEELVAELTSAFLCAELGVQGELRHAGYINNWLTLLRSDPKAIFAASSKASQAAHYLCSFSQMDGVR
jgi:Zincin-like metallopeptidase